MTFEEEFPSLKGKGMIDYPDIDESLDEWNKACERRDNIENTVRFKIKSENDVIGYFKKDIQEHCTDNQRIREAIDRYTYHRKGIGIAIKEELGL